MLTRNGRNLLAYVGQSQNRGQKNIAGTISTKVYNDFASFINNSTIFVGTGTTPASIDDYNLENRITSGVTVTVASRTQTNIQRAYDSNEPLLFVNALVSNDTEEDITINEIGIVGCSSTTYADSVTFLYTRTVLLQSLTIPAGKTYQIRVDIN